MLQHAASYNRKLLDKRLEQKRNENTLSPTESMATAPVFGGKRFDELSSDDIMAMAAGPSGKAPKIIKTKKDPPKDEWEE